VSATQPAQVTPDGEDRRSRRGWLVLVLVLLVVAVLLAVTRPWEPEPAPEVSATPSATVPSVEPSTPEPSPSVTETPALPGAEAAFDEATIATLFVTADDLVATVPAAADGVSTGITSGQLPWGLPGGSSIDPPECTVARTIVADEPTAFDARSWTAPTLDYAQEVTVLPDAARAQVAFRELVTAVDACPQYSQVNPGIDGATWTTQPAIEGQGQYPAIEQELVHAAEGQELPGYRGHLLVGNTVVTWTATALPPEGGTPDIGVLGPEADLSTMVQERALAAVSALPPADEG